MLPCSWKQISKIDFIHVLFFLWIDWLFSIIMIWINRQNLLAGNDLARVLRWGPGYTGGEDPLNLLRDVIDAEEIKLDRWDTEPMLTDSGFTGI